MELEGTIQFGLHPGMQREAWAHGEQGQCLECDVERLEALFFRLQLEMVGHYVVVDSNLGIIYTEPEVHIVTPEQRRNPALLHELFLQPPFQLIFDRSPTARHRTRLLSLRVRTPGAADSNYAHRAMFARPQGPLARLTAA